MPQQETAANLYKDWKVERKQYVVTGYGALTSLGSDYPTSEKRYLDGESAVQPFDMKDLVSHYGFLGELSNWTTRIKVASRVEVNVAEILRSRNIFTKELEGQMEAIPFVAQWGLVAGSEALADAGLLRSDGTFDPKIDRTRFGVRGSTTRGGDIHKALQQNLIDNGHRKPNANLVSLIDFQRLSSVSSHVFGLQGPSGTNGSACAGGPYAVMEAMQSMDHDDADAFLVVGSDLAVNPPAIREFEQFGAISKKADPREAIRPGDLDRDKTVTGEGAAAMVIETEEHAERRGAKIHFRIASYGEKSDSFHRSNPDPSGYAIREALKIALGRAGQKRTFGSHYNKGHLGGTEADSLEYFATQAAFYQMGYKINRQQLIFGGSKATYGHPWSGGLREVIDTGRTLETKIVGPNIHTDRPIAYDMLVPKDAIYVPDLDSATAVATGLGGETVALYLVAA